jgi:hypothetical protein
MSNQGATVAFPTTLSFSSSFCDSHPPNAHSQVFSLLFSSHLFNCLLTLPPRLHPCGPFSTLVATFGIATRPFLLFPTPGHARWHSLAWYPTPPHHKPSTPLPHTAVSEAKQERWLGGDLAATAKVERRWPPRRGPTTAASLLCLTSLPLTPR